MYTPKSTGMILRGHMSIFLINKYGEKREEHKEKKLKMDERNRTA